MIQRIWKTGIPAFLFMCVLLLLLVMPVKKIYDMVLYEIYCQETDESSEVQLVISGSNLLRANSFYLDGKRIKNCKVSRIAYDECHVLVDRKLLGESGSWHRIELAYSKWGILNLLSEPTWLQWQEVQ